MLDQYTGAQGEAGTSNKRVPGSILHKYTLQQAKRLSEHEEVLASSVMLVMAGWPYLHSANASSSTRAGVVAWCLGQSRREVRPRAAKARADATRMLLESSQRQLYRITLRQNLIHPCQKWRCQSHTFSFHTYLGS